MFLGEERWQQLQQLAYLRYRFNDYALQSFKVLGEGHERLATKPKQTC